MSIQSEITLIQNTKKDLRNAILEKGVVVSPTDLFSTYPTRISQISMTPGDEDALFRSLIERTATSLTIPNGTEVLRYGAFYNYTALTSVTIPETVTFIDGYAFSGCTGLTSITIPSSVTSIGESAFNSCSSLTSITIDAVTPPTLVGNNNNAFNNTNDCPIYVPAASVDAYKAAWTDYATRIMAIQHFEKVNSLSDVTSGQYIVVNEATGDALNSKLISSTTSSSNDINANTNTVNVTINNGVIDFNDNSYMALFEYDSAKGKLSKKVGSTTYYLRPGVSSNNYQEYFNYANKKIEYEETEVEPYEINGDFTFLFTSANKALRVRPANPSQIRWLPTSGSSYANVALYKLVE